MYIKNVSLDQRPIFLMVLGSMPFRCMAMAPPARRLWLPTCVACRPFTSRRRSVTARFTALFIWSGVTCLPGADLLAKYVPIISSVLVVCAWMCLTRRMTALFGQLFVWSDSWCIVWLRLPFFWFEMLSVIDVHFLYK